MVKSTSITSTFYLTLVSFSPPRFIFPFIYKYCSLYLYRESSLLLLKKSDTALKVLFVSQTLGFYILLYNITQESQEQLLFNIIIGKYSRYKGLINLKLIQYINKLNNLHLYRVKYSTIKLPIKSRNIDFVIYLIKLLYSILYSLNIVFLYYCIHLFLIIISY